MNRVNLVKQIPIFSKLSWIELQKIALKATLVEYQKGESIRKEGDPADFFYCLISGRVQAYSMGRRGTKENVDFIHRGMHFGIISVLTGESHSMTFEAINNSVVLRIPKEDFENILKSIPHLGVELSQDLSKRIRSKVKGIKTVFESTIISVYSPVKGTGGSTYAINLALSLEKETRKRVVFVNIHSKSNGVTATALDIHCVTDEASMRWKNAPVDLSKMVDNYQEITQNIVKGDLRIDLLNVAFDPQNESVKKQISPFVSALVGDYHYVVVDLPSDMDDVVLETLTQSDQIHLLTLDRKKELELIRHVIDQLEMNLSGNFKAEKIRVIIRAIHDKVYLSFEEINKFIDFQVYMILPFINRAQLEIDVNAKSLSFSRCAPMSEYATAVTRVAREIGGVMIGLVLGGGAALGVAHIGVIRVLERENIPVDIVVGSSMGALIGSLWTVGNNAQELETIAREFENKAALLKLLDPVFPISGLLRGGAIKRWLKKHLGSKTFYATRIPFKVIAYDLARREELVIDSGSLVEAVRKSIAIPGVMEPVLRKGQIIIDGGVLNPLPTNVLARRGIKKIIAINVLQSPGDVSEGFDIFEHQMKKKEEIPLGKHPFHYVSFRVGKFFTKIFTPNISDIIVRTLQASEYIIAEQSAQQADVVIHPDLVGINWFELNKVEELIKSGEQATLNRLPEIKKLIEE